MTRSIAETLFRPRSIAIVGASNDTVKLSGRPLDFLIRHGYQGALYPVNPKRDEVQGIRAWPRIEDLPEPADLAIVVVPAGAVVQAVEDCGKAGVRAAIIFASGFSEMAGGAGIALQEALAEAAKRTGIRLLGPNCLGSFAIPARAMATFSSAFDEEDNLRSDPVAIVSQSGAVGTFMYSALLGQGLGARYYANTGNQSDISVAEILTALAAFDDVEVLLGYMEDFVEEAPLRQAVTAARQAGKPLLLLKAGDTEAGRRSVGAHTASDPGDAARFDAVLAEGGAIRMERMEEMTDAALAFRTGRRAGGRRLSIVTSSGGASSLAADAATRDGLDVNRWSDEARERLADLLPAFGSSLNPLDLTGALLTDPTLMARAMDRLVASRETDMILVVLGNADRGSEAIVEGILQGFRATEKPFAVVWTGGSGRPRQALLAAGVPCYTDPARGVRALAHVARFGLKAPGRQ
ncbi:acetate--CoA ligase family protein [Azospirillum isscasi]|uniref:CoA-binding protein n=1 Tax=Azospirillum isscasi TaxID=3053926 RepID=A0ABU0WG42_9PROT|nr:CoA-binding protein [Azospirillum isscasi]MDQ2103028.1 CoA-binding protein [Azospirillum isscasi]